MVKYCQECGNASYDSAPICGNCGAKFPPKSQENSTPPKRDEKENKSSKTESISKTSIQKDNIIKQANKSDFADKLNKFSNKIAQKLENIDSKDKTKDTAKKEVKGDIFSGSNNKPSFSQTATVGFKNKDKGTKNPAKKFDMSKTSAEKSEENKDKKPEHEKPKVEKSDVKTSKIIKKDTSSKSLNINKQRIGIIAIIAIIIIAIAGIGIHQMQNQPTDKLQYFNDGKMSFYYSGNWSMYNNTNEEGNSSDIAFKTKDNTLIGYTTIQSDDITYLLIEEDINATARSLNGNIIQADNILVNNTTLASEYIINTSDQGYSRYICILDNGTYYSFVINNGKSSNKDISALNTTEIQNMINSIKLA